MAEQTLALIKPDGRRYTDKIESIIKGSGFRIICTRYVHLTPRQARILYSEHAGRGFFENLIGHMIRGTIVAMALEHPEGNTVNRWRELMGATNPKDAAPETIRGRFGKNSVMPANVVHGSDSVDDAKHELDLFFGLFDLVK